MDSLQATVDELIRGRGVPIETAIGAADPRLPSITTTTVACRAGAPGGGGEPRPQYALFGNDRQAVLLRQRDDVGHADLRRRGRVPA